MDSKRLSFRKDGMFKILMLTDLHYMHDDEKDHQSLSLMQYLLNAEQPDLVFLCGDTVHGPRSMECISKAVSPLKEAGIPWTFVFGNHDVEECGTHKEMFDIIEHTPGCIAYHDPDAHDGYGNHIVEVCNQQGVAEWQLFFMDSGNKNPNLKVGGFNYITRKQIDWYCDHVERIHKQNANAGNMVFMHMAVPEHMDVFRYEECHGNKLDQFGCPKVNSGLFNAMLETGTARGIFVGHDHMNDYWGDLFGIAVGYGRLSGYNAYGTADYLRGGRVFCLKENDMNQFETYIHLSNGARVKDTWLLHPQLIREAL